MRNQKEPLYRKVNTTARNVQHNFGGDYRHERNTKAEKNSEATRDGMGKKVNRGLDYTPLYRFLLSKVGKNWTEIHKEAVSRLDREEPIYWMVARDEDDKENYFRSGESSYYSGLFVDENNILQKVDPTMGPEKLFPTCACCTWTFNGIPVKVTKEQAEQNIAKRNP
jgi:hypothetical protein